MRTAGARITEREYKALQTYCKENNTNINTVLNSMIRNLLQGKVRPEPTGMNDRIPFCPRCGFVLYPNFRDKSWNCLRCGYFSYFDSIPSFQEGEKLKI